MVISEQQLSGYIKSARLKFEDRAKPDILNALQNFGALNVGCRKHKFPDGIERQTLCIYGTIPINYRARLLPYSIHSRSIAFRTIPTTFRLLFTYWTIILIADHIATCAQLRTCRFEFRNLSIRVDGFICLISLVFNSLSPINLFTPDRMAIS